jgi:ABC-type polysaccharide transport system permease subunit
MTMGFDKPYLMATHGHRYFTGQSTYIYTMGIKNAQYALPRRGPEHSVVNFALLLPPTIPPR